MPKEVEIEIQEKDYAVLNFSFRGTPSSCGKFEVMTVDNIFWYPAFDLFETELKEYFSEKRQKELTTNRFIPEGNFRVGKASINEIKKIRIFDKISDITSPILFLHGDKDVEFPFEQGHCFRNEQEEAIKH